MNIKPLISLLLGIVLLPALARAANPHVQDDAKFFSPEAIAKADEQIAQIKKTYGKDLYIETVPAIPAKLRDKYKPDQRAAFFKQWADDRARELGVNGIFVLISRDPSYLQVAVGKDTIQQAFVQKNVDDLKARMLSAFKAGQFDAGLLPGVAYVNEVFSQSLPKRGESKSSAAPAAPTRDTGGDAARAAEAARGRGAGPSAPPETGSRRGTSVMTWVCAGVGFLLVLMIVRGLMAARRSQYTPGGPGYGGGFPGGAPGGGYPPGYPGGGYPPGYPGGGGAGRGFLGGLLGGMLGGYVYDRMRGTGGGQDSGALGGGASGGSFDSPASGGDAGGGDFSSGEGGSAGGDFGGGDSGGGGGDSGGGGGDGGSAGGDF